MTCRFRLYPASFRQTSTRSSTSRSRSCSSSASKTGLTITPPQTRATCPKMSGSKSKSKTVSSISFSTKTRTFRKTQWVFIRRRWAIWPSWRSSRCMVVYASWQISPFTPKPLSTIASPFSHSCQASLPWYSHNTRLSHSLWGMPMSTQRTSIWWAHCTVSQAPQSAPLGPSGGRFKSVMSMQKRLLRALWQVETSSLATTSLTSSLASWQIFAAASQAASPGMATCARMWEGLKSLSLP